MSIIENTFRARVINVQKELFTLKQKEQLFSARISGQLRYAGLIPVIGDWVQAACDGFGSCVIHSIEERKSIFVRPDRGGHADGYVKTMLQEVIAANFDYVFIITSMNRNFNIGRIARYAAITASGGGIPVAVLTKADLCSDVSQKVEALRAVCGEMDILPISSLTGEGLDALEAYMKPGITIALLGSSGVGKSTLVNTLAGQEVMHVSAIRAEDDKGRHTTTHRQLIELRGVSLIDTPGMRQLGMCDVDDGIDDTFSDIRELQERCRFSDCRHATEPGCAIKAALRSGALSRERWELYERMHEESRHAGKMKQIAVMRKALNKRR